ncbi:hypothetical protein CHGG_07956 [Chaetomium globosum CBS 148.51]|uniref:Shugoshin n=1 Tax=Chaetomium globosum (strain ATCC 6205 / CBS 148.51 / DSM 1962 / NBRC 6347 / NRRL 1970) TaxID=306901 RepID=Q2GVP8_CHAGB|nr:uncharacterized protein CHGG_07956 [Chaetomium globosum CBS 148.51]EAQ86703.1 hypothetical protein CHGG_07956 [Chaetomium globosum CBS 148.51]
MARLNEAPVPVDSHLEILRRKFLRQNRDIAKINSDQSQKIRRLENDCARLLSENLDLRGQILRLEKQVEDNSAQRIADHALQVKEKLEHQLSEFTALLGSLGVEPPAKRRASEERMLSNTCQSMARSPPQRRRRNTSIDSEALAGMEGRLPPIYENKTYPRATMNGDEILALCAAADDTNDSSDLGPPPISQYVGEEPVKHSPPTPIETFVPENPRRPLSISSPPKLDYDRHPSRSPEPEMEAEGMVIPESPSKGASPAKEPSPEPAPQPVRAGAKRKYGDENGTIQSTTPLTGKENTALTEKAFPTRPTSKRKSLAELANVKPEKKNTKPSLSAKRTPLAAKSTNENVSSPRKVMKPASRKPAKKEQAPPPIDTVMGDETSTPSPPVEIVIPADPVLDSVTALPSATPSSPTTPHRAAPEEMLHDTPPPADISSTGETIRPSRRARAAVSYAEPNLRDKMRRPTKELFDAVTGEGKYAHRTSMKSDDQHLTLSSATKIKLEPGSSASSNSKINFASDPTPPAQQQALLSPLAQKDAFSETLPDTVVTDRRKRPSAVGSRRESLAVPGKSDGASRDLSPAVTAQPEAPAHTNSNRLKNSLHRTRNDNPAPPPPSEAAADIYDFNASSPVASSTHPTPDTNSEPKPAPSHSSIITGSRARITRKSSVAAAAALRELLDEEEHDSKSNPSRPKSRSTLATRKRASMLVPKPSSMLESLEDSSVAADADTSGASTEGEDAASRREGRVARRRSMML